MRYTIGICDDDLIQVELIKQYITNYECDEEWTIIDSAEPIRFMQRIKENKPHLVFLDVDMGETNGIDLGRQIRNMYEDTVIVYVTAYEKYALDAFETRAFDYLLKPITADKFNMVLAKVLVFIKRFSGRPTQNNFIVKTKKEIVCINCDDIIYFEKIGHRIKICLELGEAYYYDNFTNLLNKIDTETFVRCHQGYIVNVNKIKSFHNRTLFLKENIELPVSRSYLKNVKYMFNNKLFVRRASIEKS